MVFEGSQTSHVCPREMKVRVEHWWDNTDKRKLKYSKEENLSQSRFVHHKPHME